MVKKMDLHHCHHQWQLLTQHHHRGAAQVHPSLECHRTSAAQVLVHSLPLGHSLLRPGEVGVAAGPLERHRKAPVQALQDIAAL